MRFKDSNKLCFESHALAELIGEVRESIGEQKCRAEEDLKEIDNWGSNMEGGRRGKNLGGMRNKNEEEGTTEPR